MDDREELAALRRLAELEAKAGGPEKSAGYKAGQQAPGVSQGLMSAMQGPTFGFADELAGGIGALAKRRLEGGQSGIGAAFRQAVGIDKPGPTGLESLKGDYQNIRDFVRGASDAQQQENPWTTAITRGMASAPTMLVGGAPARAAGMVKNALMAGRNGAISGGVSGLGNSAADTFTDDLLNTGVGAAGGFALGLGAVPVAAGMGSMKDMAWTRINDSAATQLAKQKVAEAFARDARGTAVQANPSSIIPQATARLGKLGGEARVVDTGGQNTRQLLDTITTLPGQTKAAAEQAIVSRQAGRADRLRGAAQASLGQDGARLLTTVDNLVEQRSKDAAPLYDALYKTGVFIDDELRGIIDAANKLGAGGEARRIATAKQRDYSLEPGTKWAGMRDLDYLKQGLDDIIAANKNEFGKLTKVGAAVQGLKNDLVGILDQQTKGAYRNARDAFAGPSALIDAAKEGRAVLTRDDTQISKIMAGLTAGEKEAFRLGAFESLRSKLGNQSGQNELMKIWRDKTTAEKLQAVFGDERSFREFASRVAAENRMKALEGVGRGSQTAARQAGAGDLDVSAVGDILQSATNPSVIPGMLSRIGSKWNQVSTPEPVRDAMGRILLQQGQGAQNALQDLQEAARIVAMRRNRNANALGIASGSSAVPLTNALILPR